MMGQLNFFTKTAVTPERKVKKSIPRWEINRHAESNATNESLTKIGVVWQKSDFWTKDQDFGTKKKRSLLEVQHVLATLGKSCSKKKVAFAQNIILGDFLG